MTRADHRHLLDNRRTEAGERFDALATLFAPATFRHLEGLGAGPRPPVEVRVHDVGTEQPPGEGFDLVHARLALTHVPQRGQALRSMTEALRPGGWLLPEDADPPSSRLCPDEHGPEQQWANRLRHGFRKLLADRGADLSYGRRLPRLPREAGLHDIEAAAFFPLTSPACAALESATVRQIRADLVTAGLTTDEDIDRHLADVASGGMDLATAPMISARGGRDSRRWQVRPPPPTAAHRDPPCDRRCLTSTASPRPPLTERRPTPPPRWAVPVCRPPAPPPARPPRTPRPRPSRAPRPRAGRRGTRR